MSTIKPAFADLAGVEKSLPSLPSVVGLRERIRERLLAAKHSSVLVVLDDDPTGGQTTHDIPVITTWDERALAQLLQEEVPVFYVLTNSRAHSREHAVALAREVGRNLRRAADAIGLDVVVISRSDSTLRGHFPAEVDALADSLGGDFDGCVIVPFFPEGGRYTIGNVHYVVEGEKLVPAAETEFARDPVFGYRHSDLREWVEEKTGSRVRAADVLAISIEDLRLGGPERVAELLSKVSGRRFVIVNAAEYGDLDLFVTGVLEAESKGKRFIYRTAASFVKVRAGIGDRGLLTRSEMLGHRYGPGLVVIGSYVARTTEQLQVLLSNLPLHAVEFPVDAIMDDRKRQDAITAVTEVVDGALLLGRDAVLYTSRRVWREGEFLRLGEMISQALAAVVRRLSVQPMWMVSKGGITSSVLATDALNVRRAQVLGQILPGVPVWQLGPEARYPGMPYVVFPGNVGGPDALLKAVAILHGGGNSPFHRCLSEH
ncbi:MAG TPA: hypothetical protein EYH31_01790 [Anaerolineae bacterium]|nr:hypothetical protein [Anaerolineae bacterium]